MSEIRKGGGQFVGYEYKEIAAGGERAAFYLDCYESFGWVLDERAQENSSAGKGKLLLKRERKIVNKAELTRLQRHHLGHRGRAGWHRVYGGGHLCRRPCAAPVYAVHSFGRPRFYRLGTALLSL